jgi:hypothetical protein
MNIEDVDVLAREPEDAERDLNRLQTLQSETLERLRLALATLVALVAALFACVYFAWI